MALFLLAAFATAIVMALLIFSRPAQYWLLRSTRKSLRLFGIARPNRYIGILTLAAYFLLPPALLIIAIGPLHSNLHPIFTLSQFLLGSWFRRLVLGIIFGVLLPIWAAQLYSHSADKSWPLWLYVETAALGLLFLGGLGDVFSPAFERVTNIPTPWGPLTLASQGSRSNAAPGQDLRGLSGPAIDAPHTAGLQTLVHIGSLVKSDDKIIAALKGSVDPSVLEPIADQLDESFGALARCDLAIYDATGEFSFIRNQFGQIAPKLRAYARTLGYAATKGLADAEIKSRRGNKEAGLDLAERFVVAAATTTERAFVDDLPGGQSNSGGAAAGQDGSLAGECRDLALLPCRELEDRDPYHDGYDPLFPTIGERGVRNYCKAICPPSNCQAGCRPGDSLACGGASNLSNVTRDIVDGWMKSKDLSRRLAFRLERVTNSDPDLLRRPYLAILYADMAALDGEPAAALKEISDWLRSPPLEVEGGSAATDWYKIRAKLIAGDVVDEWLSGAGTTQVAERQLQLAIFAQIVQSLKALSETAEGLAKFRAANTSYEAFESGPEWGSACGSEDVEKLKLAYTYITNVIRYIDLAENDPEHWDGYSVVVEPLLREMHYDFSCLKRIYPPQMGSSELRKIGDLTQADIRRLEANRVLLELARTNSMLNTDETAMALRRASRIAAIANSLLKTYYQDVSAVLPENDSPLDPLLVESAASTNNAIFQTYGRIIDLQKLIASKLNGN